MNNRVVKNLVVLEANFLHRRVHFEGMLTYLGVVQEYGLPYCEQIGIIVRILGDHIRFRVLDRYPEEVKQCLYFHTEDEVVREGS